MKYSGTGEGVNKTAINYSLEHINSNKEYILVILVHNVKVLKIGTSLIFLDLRQI